MVPDEHRRIAVVPKELSGIAVDAAAQRYLNPAATNASYKTTWCDCDHTTPARSQATSATSARAPNADASWRLAMDIRWMLILCAGIGALAGAGLGELVIALIGVSHLIPLTLAAVGGAVGANAGLNLASKAVDLAFTA
jgi:hypothetical protein